MSDTDVVVRDDPDRHRYEALVDGEVVGIAVYRLNDGSIDFVHTEVPARFEGKGVGSALIHGALDAVRSAGDRRVVATCPFVAAWIDRHPSYQSLLTD